MQVSPNYKLKLKFIGYSALSDYDNSLTPTPGDLYYCTKFVMLAAAVQFPLTIMVGVNTVWWAENVLTHVGASLTSVQMLHALKTIKVILSILVPQAVWAYLEVYYYECACLCKLRTLHRCHSTVSLRLQDAAVQTHPPCALKSFI